jgi:hypothetical protein
MTSQAWIFLLLAWSVIIGCMTYCFSKLLSSPVKLSEEPSAATEPPSAEPRP